MPGVLEEVQAEVLAEVHQEGDLPHQVVGQEGGHHQTTTMVSPDLLVQILGLSPRLVREDIVDRPTQLICIWIFICQHTSTKDIAGQSARTDRDALYSQSIIR